LPLFLPGILPQRIIYCFSELLLPDPSTFS